MPTSDRIDSARFPSVPLAAALAYDDARAQLVAHVNAGMDAHSDIGKLIGRNPRSVMYGDHRNHARFMTNVFKMNEVRLLLNCVPWIYHSYCARGFSLEYFPIAFGFWQEAVEKHLRAELAEPIAEFYRRMVSLHETFIEMSSEPPWPPPALRGDWKQEGDAFLSAVLRGDHQRALQLAEHSVGVVDDMKGYYLEVMQPTMYHIGFKWETGEISVAHEHLATAIVSRVMAALYPRFLTFEHPRGRAVVSACPEEYHELGPRMVADFLELDGWDVTYLGASTPIESLLGIVEERRPHFFALSVTMPFNIDRAFTVVEQMRQRAANDDMKVLVGGQAFRGVPDIAERMDADAFVPDAQKAVELVRQWSCA